MATGFCHFLRLPSSMASQPVWGPLNPRDLENSGTKRRVRPPSTTQRTQACAPLTRAGVWLGTATCKFSIVASDSTSKQPSSSTWMSPGTKGVKRRVGQPKSTSPSLRHTAGPGQPGERTRRTPCPSSPSLMGDRPHPRLRLGLTLSPHRLPQGAALGEQEVLNQACLLRLRLLLPLLETVLSV